jgi:uncharacterized protein (DUF3820 family)
VGLGGVDCNEVIIFLFFSPFAKGVGRNVLSGVEDYFSFFQKEVFPQLAWGRERLGCF